MTEAAYTRPEDELDYKNPNYDEIVRARVHRLAWIRTGTPEEVAQKVAELKAFYAKDENAAQFITDWCVTADPRNAERDLPVIVPFVLWPKQREFIDTAIQHWRRKGNSAQGLEVVKSRDQGASWLCFALFIWVSVFHNSTNCGLGSRKEELVDKAGDPKCLFHKGRTILTHLPVEFRAGWTDHKANSSHMKLAFPETGSTITGEAGDSIGRGDRCTMYGVDEAAFLEHPDTVDAALIATTNCRIELSSVNGMANKFAERVHSGKHRVLVMDWRSDPRRSEEWYKELCDTADPIVVASEYDMDFAASVEGQIIESKWAQAAVGAARKLGLHITGEKRSAFDVADVGKDKCAWGVMHGIELTYAESWSGKDGDTLDSTHRVYRLCDEHGVRSFVYDADGMGGPTVKPNSKIIGEQRAAYKPPAPVIQVIAFQGSGAVWKPEAKVPGAPDRRNEDFFMNYKAQCYWFLRRRFIETWRALQGKPYDPELIISISEAPEFKERAKLLVELSQPIRKFNTNGKLLVDKTPDGAASPNLADMVMMLAGAPRRGGMRVSDSSASAFEAMGAD
jgi:phage terminase large subunit